MSVYEALTVLGLKPRATQLEIKAAYRKHVKAWHPDLFGHDVGLLREAEITLREINLAYEVLRDYGIEHQDPYGFEQQEHIEARPSRSSWNWMSFLLGGVAIVVTLVLVRYGFEKDAPEYASGPIVSTAPVRKDASITRPAEDPGVRKEAADSGAVALAPASPAVSPVDAVAVARVSPAVSPVAAVAPAKMPRVKESPSFAGVSAGDTSSIMTACAAEKDAFARCEKRQLIALSHAPAKPGLSGLDESDRRSIESACSGVASLKGPATYRVCLLKKLEERPYAIHLP